MAVSELPGNPNAVWTVKKLSDGKTSASYFLAVNRLFVTSSSNFSLFYVQYFLSLINVSYRLGPNGFLFNSMEQEKLLFTLFVSVEVMAFFIVC